MFLLVFKSASPPSRKTVSQILEAVEKTLNASSFKGNPIPLNEGELRKILEKAL
jgi:hypothetical protein